MESRWFCDRCKRHVAPCFTSATDYFCIACGSRLDHKRPYKNPTGDPGDRDRRETIDMPEERRR